MSKVYGCCFLHPQDSRRISVTGRTVRSLGPLNSPLILCRSSLADMLPSSVAGWRTVEIGGLIKV
jgi:hypothetical protein